MITQFPSFNECRDVSSLQKGAEFSGVGVTKLLFYTTHSITWMWIWQEKPGAPIGSWPLVPLLLQREGVSKGPADSVLGHFVGHGAEERLWHGSHVWHCSDRDQGQHEAGIPVGPSSPALVQRSVGSGSKGTCAELSSAEQRHSPYSVTQLPGGLSITVCHYFGLGNVSHGSSPTILPLFPDYCLGSARERSSYCLCLGKPHGRDPRRVRHLVLVPGGEYLSVGKTPSLFVLYFVSYSIILCFQ